MLTFLLLYIAQLALVPIVGMSILILVASMGLLGAANGIGDLLGGELIFGFVIGLGGLLGFMAASWFPRLYPSGKRVWIVPLVLYVALGVLIAITGSVGQALRNLFDPRATEEGLGVVLLTIPTMLCCGYSLGTLGALPS